MSKSTKVYLSVREKDQAAYFEMLQALLKEMWKAKMDAIEAGKDRLEEEKINQFRQYEVTSQE